MQRYRPEVSTTRPKETGVIYTRAHMTMDSTGEWVRFADVPGCTVHEGLLREAEAKLSQARAANAGLVEARDTAEVLSASNVVARLDAEFELRQARAELVAEKANHARAVAYADLLAKDNRALRGVMTPIEQRRAGIAGEDASWCCDMAAAPRHDQLLIAFPGVGPKLCIFDEGHWQTWAPCGQKGVLFLNPYAWRSVQAPPYPKEHHVPPVGSKL